MEHFVTSSFGVFLSSLFVQHFTAPSWQNFVTLASGWSMACTRHTIANYLWLCGAVSHKHFSRYYFLLSGPVKKVEKQLWSAVIVAAEKLIPQDQPLHIKVDDMVKKKSGKKITAASRYRNSAGTARQEYRVLFGINFVYAILLVPVQLLSTHWLAIPIGLKVYLKKPCASALGQNYHSRSALARKMVDLVANLLPHRQIQVVGDGGYATKEFLRDLPDSVKVVLRFPISSKLYALPKPPPKGRRGRKPKKGELIGSPKSLINQPIDWINHPTEKRTLVADFTGLWHTVLPGVVIRIVIVYRKAYQPRLRFTQKRVLEAFFTTDLTLSRDEILAEYPKRWAIEISIRDAFAYYGLGQDMCRNYQRIVGINTFRLLMAAARTLWVSQQISDTKQVNLKRFRPWYRQKQHLSQLDIAEAYREALYAAGITPTVRFLPDMREIHQSQDTSLPRAA